MTGTVRNPAPMNMESELLKMDDEDFRNIVDADLRDFDHSGKWALGLRSPAVVERWHATLTAMLKSVEGQLAAREADWTSTKARLSKERIEVESDGGLMESEFQQKMTALDLEFETEREKHFKTKAGTMRFKTGLEEWLVEAGRIRDSITDKLYESVVSRERNYYAERARALEDGITQHQKMVQASSVPSEADEKLWSLLP
jgi:hypothetical protein